ncbi:glutathione peroxidase [Flavobacterium amniphilum]|uniref:glutathione peroxidase n=1 Tax=Flavobacterium amniphilum TaxID=1834035 RepID=UPI002029D656|nr:glutathione peroxidase [Flavobacterium amniphilum]MCL9805734.1 glutathione peroxidase [Flavobacterium amniphilum]MCL9806321.1 glutathione peroxidase [Flavobacterium amniphilum]
MKNIVVILSMILAIGCQGQEKKNKNTTDKKTTKKEIMAANTIYQFKVKDISGNDFDLASLKGKKVMIVNTASECGLTPQYEQLQELYTEFKDDNFTIIGFPANNFGAQEPGSNEQIATFCQRNYGVTFPMMEKISVKGDDTHALYQFLTHKDQNGLEDNEVKWNFQKYLINEDGTLAKVIGPETLPIDETVIKWIKP